MNYIGQSVIKVNGLLKYPRRQELMRMTLAAGNGNVQDVQLEV